MKNTFKITLVIIWTLFIQGCGTTKSKDTSRTNEKTEVNSKVEKEEGTKVITNETSEEKKDAVKTVDSAATDVKKTTVIEESSNLTIKGDGSGKIDIEEENTPTGKKTTITGAKEIIFNNTKKETFKIDSLNVIVKRKDSVNEYLKSQKSKDSLSYSKSLEELEARHQKNIRETNTKIKRNAFWMWVSFGLFGFILLQNRKRILGWIRTV